MVIFIDKGNNSSEGKDDIAAVKSAIDAEVIATGGFGYNDELVRSLEKIAKLKA